MTRLPIPGQDDGAWGQILNDFLEVEHNPNGTLKSRDTIISKANDSAVVHNTGDETIAGTKTFLSSPVVPTPTLDSQATNKIYVDSTVSAGAPDATTTRKGIVQLAGDLSGTATAPTVPALALKANDSTVVHNTGDETIAGVKTFTSSPVVPSPTLSTQVANKTYVDSTVAAGAPDATTTNKGIVQLAGDLSGTATAPTVPALATKEDVANKDTNTALGTSDVHYPSQNAVKTYVDTGLATKEPTLGYTPENVANKSTSTALGTSNTLYPSQNAVKSYVDTTIAAASAPDATTTTKGIVQLAGDLSGTATAPTVPGLATKENVANKSTNTALGTSDTLYPSQNAVKTYVDTGLATKLTSASNLSDLNSASAARTNLGLGTLATQSGTFSGTSSGTNTGDQVISDATLTTSDITTNNVSTTKHGFAPKAPNDATKFLDGTGAYSVPLAPRYGVVALVDGPTIATDASQGNVFTVTLGGNRTISNPTNPLSGQKLIYRLTQDATGSRTVTWDTMFRFGIDVPTPVLTSTINKTDYIGFIYNATSTTWDCVAVSRGY